MPARGTLRETELIMKKQFKLTVIIDTESQEAKKWAVIDHYVSDTIDDALCRSRVMKNHNYSLVRDDGTVIKSSLRKIKDKKQ